MKRIVAYKNYYRDFMLKLTENERTKIKRALLLFETEDKIPRHYISIFGMGYSNFVSHVEIKSFACSIFTMEIKW